MGRVRDMHGGRDYDSTWETRMSGEGEYARIVERRFQAACRRLGLNAKGKDELDTTKFRAPRGPQASLFSLLTAGGADPDWL